MNPQTLADQIVRTVGDADSNTAHAALEIANKITLVMGKRGNSASIPNRKSNDKEG